MNSPAPPVKKSAGPPPPPPGKNGLTIGKANKLNRSPQMSNLYRLLKDKIEGNGADKKSASKNSNRNTGNGGLSMSDALAEMTKRSSYFKKIEEDFMKYGPSILEIQSALVAFKTTNMTELLKFHQFVEEHLENLTDERQVLLRFEGFPFEKLETLRMAAGTYLQLEGIVSTLKGWRFTAPTANLPTLDQLNKIDSYFNKIEKTVNIIECNKEIEAKKFQSQNLTFDYGILVRIKEEMVSVSSSCIEMALKESKQAKATGKAEKLRSIISSMLWRVFQFAFRAYIFAGGQDDRADRLSAELAHELQTYIIK